MPAFLRDLISESFSAVEYPGDPNLCRRGFAGSKNSEHYLLAREFRGKKTWRTLSPQFLDNAPNGYGSSLCFFSDAAFRFYLPAYMLADLEGKLENQDPVFHLTLGLGEPINFNAANATDIKRNAEPHLTRLLAFTKPEANAIIQYLLFCLNQYPDDYNADDIRESIKNFWEHRAT